MNFNEFKNYVEENIKDVLPPKYADCDVQINEISKNNEVLSGLLITSPDSNMSPTVYLDSFYEQYQNGISLDDILNKIADIRIEHEVDKDFNISKITSWENVKDSIGTRLLGTEENENLLNQRPHKLMDDLAVFYCVELGADKNGAMSIPITNQLMDTWKVDQKTLHEAALNNIETLAPSTFKSMTEVMVEMMLPQMMNDMGVDETTAREMIDAMLPPEEKMYVLSNVDKLNGATALLDEKIMDEIADKLGEDYFILPSSVHEVLIVPESAGMDIKELEVMVQEVNATEVAPQDRLSNHVYKYDEVNREVVRADKNEKTLSFTKESMKEDLAEKKASEKDARAAPTKKQDQSL